MMNKQTLLLFSMVLVASLTTQAQENSNSLALDVTQPKEESPFRLTLGLGAATNLHKQGTPNHEAWTELVFAPSYQLSEKSSVGLKTFITREETKARNTMLSNTSISFKTKGPKFGDIGSGFSVTGVLPTDEQEYKKSRFQGALGLGTSFSGQWKQLQISYGLSGSRNFHEYTLNANRSPLVQHSLTQSLGVDLELSSKWSLSTAGTYKIGRTYQDFERQAYAFQAGVNYSFSKKVQASLGWSNEGRALRADGTATNIQFYNENTSVVTAGVTLVN